MEPILRNARPRAARAQFDGSRHRSAELGRRARRRDRADRPGSRRAILARHPDLDGGALGFMTAAATERAKVLGGLR